MAQRWGTNMPVDPQAGLTREQIRQANGMAPSPVALVPQSSEQPAEAQPVSRATPTVDAVKAWLAQHTSMRETTELELQAARTRVAELEALLAEIDAVKPV